MRLRLPLPLLAIASFFQKRLSVLDKNTLKLWELRKAMAPFGARDFTTKVAFTMTIIGLSVVFFAYLAERAQHKVIKYERQLAQGRLFALNAHLEAHEQRLALYQLQAEQHENRSHAERLKAAAEEALTTGQGTAAAPAKIQAQHRLMRARVLQPLVTLFEVPWTPAEWRERLDSDTTEALANLGFDVQWEPERHQLGIWGKLRHIVWAVFADAAAGLGLRWSEVGNAPSSAPPTDAAQLRNIWQRLEQHVESEREFCMMRAVAAVLLMLALCCFTGALLVDSTLQTSHLSGTHINQETDDVQHIRMDVLHGFVIAGVIAAGAGWVLGGLSLDKEPWPVLASGALLFVAMLFVIIVFSRRDSRYRYGREPKQARATEIGKGSNREVDVRGIRLPELHHAETAFEKVTICCIAAVALTSAIFWTLYNEAELKADQHAANAIKQEIEIVKLGTRRAELAFGLTEIFRTQLLSLDYSAGESLTARFKQPILELEHRLTKLHWDERHGRGLQIPRGFGPIEDRYFPERYYFKEPIETAARLFALWSAAHEQETNWHARGIALLGGLALFATALYLLGQSLSMPGKSSVPLALAGLLIASFGASQAFWLWLPLPPEAGDIPQSMLFSRDYPEDAEWTIWNCPKDDAATSDLFAHFYALGQSNFRTAHESYEFEEAADDFKCAFHFRPSFAFARSYHVLARLKALSLRSPSYANPGMIDRHNWNRQLAEAYRALSDAGLSPRRILAEQAVNELTAALIDDSWRLTSEEASVRSAEATISRALSEIARENAPHTMAETARTRIALALADLAMARYPDAERNVDRALDALGTKPELRDRALHIALQAIEGLHMVEHTCTREYSSLPCSRSDARTPITSLKKRVLHWISPQSPDGFRPTFRANLAEAWPEGVVWQATLANRATGSAPTRKDDSAADPAYSGDLLLVWYALHPAFNVWTVVKELAARVAFDARQPMIGTATSTIAMVRPHRCLQEGQYRVEVYANGELIDERTTEIEKAPDRSTPRSPADMIAPDFQSVFPGDDLRLMSVATVDGLVNEGRNLVVVALVGTGLHIRIFDASGKKVVDKAENELVSGGTLTALKQRLTLVPDESGLSKEDKQKIIEDARSITRHTLSPLTRVWFSRIFPELNLGGCLPHNPQFEPPESSGLESEGLEPPPPGYGFFAQESERDSRARLKQGLETQWIVEPKTEPSLDQWITNRATEDRLLLRMRFSGDDEAALGAAASEVETDLSALLKTSPANWSAKARSCEVPADIGEVRWSRFTYPDGRGIAKVWKGSDGIVYVAVSLVNTAKAVPTAESTQCAMLNSVQNLDRGRPGF